MSRNICRKCIGAILSVMLIIALFPSAVWAEPEGEVDSTNLWESGGQITVNLSGCDGYDSISVTVSFNGTITEAGGWGFDIYTVDGNKVIAVVSATGPNAWGYNNNVGIQVSGSGITEAQLISVEGNAGIPVDTAKKPEPTEQTQAEAVQETSAETVSETTEETHIDSESHINASSSDDWLTTDGDMIVDMNGNPVWLTGVSWFGYNTGTNIFDGCWSCSMKEALESIADHGFNLLRIPISAELLLNWRDGVYPKANYNTSTNSDLEGKNSLEIFEYALSICKDNGLKVMLDIHSCKTDAMGHNMPLWYTDDFTATQYFEAVSWMAERWGNDDTIVAYDLKNEPHGAGNEDVRAVWNDTNNPSNWKAAAEKAGNIILDVNPHALIVIEGIQIYPKDIGSNNFISMNEDDYYNSWWGGNLRAVRDYPIDFGSEALNKQVVYSPHDYGPAVYQQPWFYEGFSYDSLKKDYWYDSWLYIDDEKIAPLLIGEWGGFMSGDNLTWMTYMRELIANYQLNHTFWCFNANSGDTGGLVLDDFTTWDNEKYEFVKPVLWQNSDGKFIGLDHQVPLGSNGICLSDYTGDTVIPLEMTESADSEDDKTTEMTDNTSDEQTSSAVTTASEEGKSADEEIMDGMNRFVKISVVILSLIFATGIGIIFFVQFRKNKNAKHI